MLWAAVYALKDELTSKQPLDACAAIPVPEIAHPQQIEFAVTLLTCTRSSLQVLLGKLTSFMSFCYCKIHKQVENECNFFFSLADYSPQLELTFSARCNSVLINGNTHSEKTRANFQTKYVKIGSLWPLVYKDGPSRCRKRRRKCLL